MAIVFLKLLILGIPDQLPGPLRLQTVGFAAEIDAQL